MRSGASRQRQLEIDAATSGGRHRLLDGRLDRRPQVVRPQVEQDEPGIELRELEQVLGEPVEPLELDAARLEELGPGGRVLAGLVAEQLVEREQGRDRRPQLVGHVGEEVAAPVAIAPDDRDALLEPVGHRVELDGQLGQLRRAGPDVGPVDALGEVALRERSRRLRQAPERGGEAVGHRGGDDDATCRARRCRRPPAGS